jgi:hypothetical protein
MTASPARKRVPDLRRLAIGVTTALVASVSVAQAEPARVSRLKITTDGTVSDSGKTGGIALSAPARPVEDGAVLLDLRGRDDDRGSSEVDLGTGYRHRFGSGWDVGAHSSIDRRQSISALPQHRLDVGVDARRGALAVNAGAFASTRTDDSARVDVTGGRLELQTQWLSIATQRTSGPASRRIDADIGRAVALFGRDSGVRLNLSAGAFQTIGNGTATPIGQRGRVSLQADRLELLGRRSSFSMDGRIEDDGVDDAQVGAEFRLNIPLQRP